MQGRHIARELALMLLFQLEHTDTSLPTALPAHFDASATLRQAVQALATMAADQLADATIDLKQALDALAELESNDETNLSRPLHQANQPVTLPRSDAARKVMQDALHATQLVSETLRAPHLLANLERPDIRAYAEAMVKLTLANAPALDATITAHASDDWPVKRLPKLDRLILRLAVAELTLERVNDPAVTVNEAILLAKTFSQEESYRFINGVLDSVCKAERGSGLPA